MTQVSGNVFWSISIAVTIVSFAALGVAVHDKNEQLDTAQAKVETGQTLGEQVREACRRDRLAVEAELGISCERGEVVAAQAPVDDAEIDDPEPDDPDPDDPEVQDPEQQDPEVDDEDPDDPETQESEVQEFEVQDPQDPPTTLRLYEADGVTVFRVCTLLPGPDAEVRDYRCDLP